MLKQESIEEIFSKARAKGLSCAELYLERTMTETLFFQGKYHKSLISQVSGASLLCKSATGFVHYSISDIAPEALLEVLGESSQTKLNALKTIQGNLTDATRREKLLALARKVESLSPQFHFEYMESKRDFAVINELGKLTQSDDEQVHFFYQVQKDANTHRVEELQSSIDSFWQKTYSENSLLDVSRERFESPSLWPLPTGEIPVLLSHQSLSKILFKVLKGFEADNLVNQHSFLNFLEDSIPFSFSLLEFPLENPTDQEGETTRTLELFSHGEFKEFATNKRLASTLSLPKSGHGRRMNYQQAPTISLFSPKLIPNDNLWLNLSSLQKAIFLEELDILSYDPRTTLAKISVTHSKLIHHGDFGEKLVKWEWDISLLDLLKSLKQFSKDSTLHGFQNKKGVCILPTQITCPDALVEGLPLPGTVPPEYYWE